MVKKLMHFYTKIIFELVLIFNSVSCFSLSLLDLTNYALEANTEIRTAMTVYEDQKLAYKFLNGAYVPSVLINSTTKIPNEFEWKYSPDYFSSSLIYTQPLPGGTSVSIEANYCFNAGTVDNERYITQSPNITFTLSQSLLPYWFQGKIKDPQRLTFEQQIKYYYYELLNTKKNVMIQILQNYVYNLIALHEIAINQNSIVFYEKQIESLKELQSLGNISQAKILEIENSKLTAQQNLMLAQSNSTGYIQNLKTLCGKDFDENFLDSSITEGYESIIIQNLNNTIDPLINTYELKFQMLDSSRIIEKQSSAPILSMSFTPVWNFGAIKEEKWKSAWENNAKPSNWTFSVGLNITPILIGFAKQKNKRYKLEYTETQNNFNSYIKQKEFVKKQYETLLTSYLQQKSIITELYNSAIQELMDYEYQVNAGFISKLDFESVRVRVENCRHSKECIELYVWLYEILLKLQ